MNQKGSMMIMIVLLAGGGGWTRRPMNIYTIILTAITFLLAAKPTSIRCKYLPQNVKLRLL